MDTFKILGQQFMNLFLFNAPVFLSNRANSFEKLLKKNFWQVIQRMRFMRSQMDVNVHRIDVAYFYNDI